MEESTETSSSRTVHEADPASFRSLPHSQLLCLDDRPLVVKRLNGEKLEARGSEEDASKDLALEAQILLKLPKHENIISLFGLSANFWEEPLDGFLLLETLSETLHDRLNRWRSSWQGRSNFVKASLSGKRGRLLSEKSQASRILNIGLPLARAMSFLHHHNIHYRDLKPHDVGFNSQTGELRLFDFGLTREYHEDDERVMTGFTGSALHGTRSHEL